MGGKSIKAVTAIPQARTENESLRLTTMEGEEQSIPLTDISYRSEYDSDLAALHAAQSSFLWPAALISGGDALDVPLAVTFDEGALAGKLQALPCFTDPSIQPPVDAHIEKTDAGFTIREAVEGNALDYNAVWNTVTETLTSGGLAVDLAESGCYQKPQVFADDPGLREQMAIFKRYSNLNLTIDLTDVVETLSYTDFQSWLETDGMVNTISAGAPFNAPSKALDKDNIAPGVWNVTEPFRGDHMVFCGDLLRPYNIRPFFAEWMNMINSI